MATDANFFHDLASGRKRGVGAALSRFALRLLEMPYSLAMRWRNHRYDSGRATIHCVGVPVVSVGNVTLGGTGKTPMVLWIARWFAEQNIRAAIVSRGYGAAADKPNDEAMELTARLPKTPHVQYADRVAAARLAIEQHAAEAIVLDDGFQHRRLARDLDVVLLDALEPFGYEHVFPRGALREPLAGLSRADVVALSRSDQIEPIRRDEIRRRVERLAPGALWLELVHAPISLVNSAGAEQPLDALAGKRLVAFCGLGNPRGFAHTLSACGYDPLEVRSFPDHHAYNEADIAELADWSRRHRADAILCTRKDLVKLPIDRLGDAPLWALSIDLKIIIGREAFEEKLRQAIQKR